MIRLFIVLVIFFLSNFCFAQTDTFVRSSMDDRADSYSDNSQTNLKVEDIYNKTLNLLDSINTTHSAYYRERLIKSHNAWSTYSSYHCAIEAYQSRDAATGGDIFYHNCITSLNKSRIEALEELLLNFQREFDEQDTNSDN